ncbi:MAG TPA: hypothetical protein VLC91_05325, partial [Spongiibacteraceae bacterium]|nr:hypothetical protein [Spongiibacteraceae bacterium]
MRRNSIYRIDIAIWAVAVAGYVVTYKLWEWSWAELFWDFDIYVRAVTDAVLGANPYRRGAGLPFLYHPVVLYAFIWLDRL